LVPDASDSTAISDRTTAKCIIDSRVLFLLYLVREIPS
jgi:hypothetical protein